jgi:hypothetical protein
MMLFIPTQGLYVLHCILFCYHIEMNLALIVDIVGRTSGLFTVISPESATNPNH